MRLFGRVAYTVHMDNVSRGEATNIIVNPYYAVTLSDDLFVPHEARESQEDWVSRNIELIQENGVSEWLHQLLNTLSVYSGPVTHELISPYKAIVLSNNLRGEHAPLMSREKWVEANKNVIAEVGEGQWLWLLLETLVTGGPKLKD
jgi:hypothetical protein